MEELEQMMSSKDPASWEQAYLDLVESGKVGIDEWILSWLWHRVEWPGKDYSIFRGADFIVTSILRVNIVIRAGFKQKIRHAEVIIYTSNREQPDFYEFNAVGDDEWRFPSIGNPYLDEINYRWWEQYLLCKLIAEILIEKKGLDMLIESVRRNM